MKRAALVAYSSSEEEGNAQPKPQEQSKRRKLPPLSSKLTVQAPADNPALHQGRTRATPHVDGQWASYVFVPLRAPPGSAMSRFLRQVLTRAKEMVPTLHPIGLSAIEPSAKDEGELRISLTRPIYLRAHQREEFKMSVRRIAKQSNPFNASFTSFAELVNDERTRTFLTLEVGAGHQDLKIMCDALNPVLHVYRQRSFYDEPRFHASIAWVLLSKLDGEISQKHREMDIDELPLRERCREQEADSLRSKDEVIPTDSTDPVPDFSSTDPFPTIPCLPPDLIRTLQNEYGSRLHSRAVGIFDVEHICVKMGKDIIRWKLGQQ